MKRIKNRKKHFRINNPLGFSLFCAAIILILGLIAGAVFFVTSGGFRETLNCVRQKMQDEPDRALSTANGQDAEANTQDPSSPEGSPNVSETPGDATETPGAEANATETPEIGTPQPETPTPPPIEPETPDPGSSDEPTKRPEGPLSGITVGLDPTRDGGSKYKTEGKFNLEFAQKLGAYLESKGATVVITRDNNSKTFSNSKRAKTIKDANCDIALRLMCNHIAAKNSGCYAQSPSKYKSYATDLISAYSKTTGIRLQAGKTNGYEKKSDDVTGKCGCPCVMLIMGNWDNKSDRAILQDEAMQQKIFELIYEQILKEVKQ